MHTSKRCISEFEQPLSSLCLLAALCVTGAGRTHWVITKVQVAMAIAVIKSCPPGTTSREYAEALAHQLVVQDSGLRTRVQELQQEVLRLRQEMALSKAATTSVMPALEATGTQWIM